MVKIIKRDFNLTNTLAFIILSIIFICAIQSLSLGVSLFSFNTIKLVLIGNFFVFGLFLLTVFMVGKFKKNSQWLFLLYTIIVVIKSFVFLASGFNKLVLGLNFIYLLFAFYFFTTWELYVLKAAHNPNFSEIDLEKESRFNITGHIENLENEKLGSFVLTNIDHESCFVLMEGESTSIIENSLRLVIDYENVRFTSRVELISKNNDGLGFAFLESDNGLRSLSGLCKICLQRGLV